MAKIEWVFQDEQGTNLNRYIATNVSTGEQITFDLNRGGSISIVGTPLNAERLNSLVNAINDLYENDFTEKGGIVRGNVTIGREEDNTLTVKGKTTLHNKLEIIGGEISIKSNADDDDYVIYGNKQIADYNTGSRLYHRSGRWYYENDDETNGEIATRNDLKYRGGKITTILNTSVPILETDLNVGLCVSKAINVGGLKVGDILRVYVGGNNTYYAGFNGGVFEIEVISYTNTSSPENPSGYCGKGGLIVPLNANSTQSFIISGSVYSYGSANLDIEVYALTSRSSEVPIGTTQVFVHKIEKISF